MLLNPLSLMGSSYADNALSWSAQRTLNWLPETAEVEGTRTPIKFADPPGLRAVVDLGTGLPIRGLHNVEGKLFAVSSTSLFEISTSFGVTNRGNIPGVTRVSMAHNRQGGVVAANELVIANGLSGYVYNTSTATLSQITDDAFQGATTVDYVDGYITFTDPQGRFWGHSALNQATSFSSIDRYDAESAPDPIISHIVSHREVMVFGTRTIEFFRNTGAATGTFQRVDGTELEVGICSPYARSRVDNSVCWVSDGLEVFRLEGHAPQRISNRPIEQLLATVNPANIFTFAWEDRGHKVFYVTAPEAFTIGFDFASGMWHERQTFDIPRWRANDLVSWNGLWIVGDYSNGLLYVLDWDTHHENGLPLVRERASGYTHGGQNKVLAPYVELLFDVGPDGDPPEIVGDVPDGNVGDPVSGAYTVSGGIAPYGPITVLSGTFPAGLTLNPDGTYSGTYTTEGSYSWTVGGVDAFGSPFSTPDTAVVSVVPEVILYAELDTQGAHAYRIGYGVWNDDTSSVDFIASKTYVDGDGTSTSPKRPGVTLNGDIIATVPDTWNGTTVAGIYALRPNGANLDEIDHYRSSTEEFAQYHGCVLAGGDILAACPDPVDPAQVQLTALSWDGIAFSEVATLNIGNVTIREINGHKGGVAVLLSNQQVRFYTYDGATITAAGTYTHPITGANRDAVSIVSDDDYLYLDNGLILEAAGGNITLHAQIPWGGTNFPPLGRIAIQPGYIAIYNRSGDYGVIPVNTLGVWSFNGTSTSLVTSTACNLPRGDYAMVWSEGRLYLADLFDTAGSGDVFTFNGSTLTRVADMELPPMAGNDAGASLWVGAL